MQNCSKTKEYFENSLSHGFLNTITKATRIDGESFSLIDHIFTNKIDRSESGVILSDITDHFLTFISIGPKLRLQKTEPNTFRDFSNINMDRFKMALANLNWHEVYICNDVNSAHSTFWGIFSMLFELYFPCKVSKKNRRTQKMNGFMTAGLLISRIRKFELHKLYISSPTALNQANYRSYRNVYNKVLRNSKKLFYEQKLSLIQNDPKKVWNTMNELLCRKQANTESIDSLKVGNDYISDSVDIANSFNTFFSNIGLDIAAGIPASNIHHSQYLDDVPNNFNLTEVSASEVNEAILSFESKSSQDVFSLNTKLIKHVAKELSMPLSFMFNKSFELGIFPEDYKTSRTVPVFKSGNKEDMNNYRPISCLPVFGKVLEKIVSRKLIDYLSSNKLLHPYQFGFQPKKSTVHPVMHFLKYISEAMNDNDYCVAIFLDLRKAFDLVNHEILISKLEKLGIRNNSLAWFKSYLQSRKQLVMVNGKLSNSTSDIIMSVLQGSILGQYFSYVL